MGYISNRYLIITTYGDDAAKVHGLVTNLLKGTILEKCISPVVPHPINGDATIFIAPDGSKEGWEDSDKGDTLTKCIKTLLDNIPEYVDWIEVTNDEDNAPRVTDSNDQD